MPAVAAFPIHSRSPDEEHHVLLQGVPWATYVVLRDCIESPGVRMTYREGSLDIMSTARAREVDKKQIARLFELFCLERNIPLYAYGSMTFREEAQKRGIEPDECYCRGVDKPVPDVAIEVVKTHGAVDKLDVYCGLGVREVWVFEDGAFSLFALREQVYEQIAASPLFPEVDFSRLAHFVRENDQHAALVAYRNELRSP